MDNPPTEQLFGAGGGMMKERRCDICKRRIESGDYIEVHGNPKEYATIFCEEHGVKNKDKSTESS